jgi:hypothetical protein
MEQSDEMETLDWTFPNFGGVVIVYLVFYVSS